MTIAITIKVNDGVVMATDSATTMFSPNGSANYIYHSANKLFNLYKGLPIGLQTAGLGMIGQSSIGTLVKDFRERIMNERDTMTVNPENYTIQDVAEKFKRFIYDYNYINAFQPLPPEQRPLLVFRIAGYSTGQSLPEVWDITIRDTCNGPTLIQSQDVTGACWTGEPEPITRLMMGFGTKLLPILKDIVVDDNLIDKIIERCRMEMDAGFITAPMPIQDAIELSSFLVETASKWAKYRPGADSIGGPTDIAAITKYEGFKWIQRKHYFGTELNP